MGIVWLLFLCASATIIVVGLVSPCRCRLDGRLLSKRVPALYFWVGLGLAYGLWFLWLGLAMFREDMNLPHVRPAYGMGLPTMILSPIVYAFCAIVGITKSHSCKSFFETVSVFAIAATAIPCIWYVSVCLDGV